MPRTSSRRVTQKRIAELAGVSQATVSMVLNERRDGPARIPDPTRQRVLRIIQETQYVADPSARRLAGVDSQIVGVFTYEPAFPSESQDFYAPLLTGIEAEAEELGCDLLVFTSAPVTDGRRRLFGGHSRLRLADGVLLLGVEMDADELDRLVDEAFRVVAVGRRVSPRIPYVGIDYVSAAKTLVRRAVGLGHTRVLSLRLGTEGESVHDRRAGVLAGVKGTGAELTELIAGPEDLDQSWGAVARLRPTLVIVEDSSLAEQLVARADREGMAVPEGLSVIGLSAPERRGPVGARLTSLDPPRIELGRRCLALLTRLLSDEDRPDDTELRSLLPCPMHDGETLAAPPARRANG
ncbi:LacI family DNA-binding transcriptional regulator [Brachybacterium alimentarium]|uniref:LacI family DNA-binding transcriptional regulator n=1 Tax=Brachybacterium alimentarium TaxID=47845 RepID=UPI000DF2D471|nr:LacI family DNA-binding transcriptional regulator [Brachybacterium alimentarium]RCS78888.1 LacI family transcriptional regulator [Brachybacterium alimentarium]